MTRLEITKTRFPPGFGLADLPKLKNPLDGVRLSYGDVLGEGDPKLWRAYLALRMGVGHAEATSRLPIEPTLAAILGKRYRNHPSNLLVSDSWGGWESGLSASGFASFVALATEGKELAKA